MNRLKDRFGPLSRQDVAQWSAWNEIRQSGCITQKKSSSTIVFNNLKHLACPTEIASGNRLNKRERHRLANEMNRRNVARFRRRKCRSRSVLRPIRQRPFFRTDHRQPRLTAIAIVRDQIWTDTDRSTVKLSRMGKTDSKCQPKPTTGEAICRNFVNELLASRRRIDRVE